MVDFGKGAVVPFPELIEELFDLIAEDAALFRLRRRGRQGARHRQGGTSADRQLARFEAVKELGGSEQAALVAVVDGIIDDTMMVP